MINNNEHEKYSAMSLLNLKRNNSEETVGSNTRRPCLNIRTGASKKNIHSDPNMTYLKDLDRLVLFPQSPKGFSFCSSNKTFNNAMSLMRAHQFLLLKRDILKHQIELNNMLIAACNIQECNDLGNHVQSSPNQSTLKDLNDSSSAMFSKVRSL